MQWYGLAHAAKWPTLTWQNMLFVIRRSHKAWNRWFNAPNRISDSESRNYKTMTSVDDFGFAVFAHG
jgi:hypothetical protein